MAEIISALPSSLPRALSLEDQGRFAVGYYHQRWVVLKNLEKNGGKNGQTDSPELSLEDEDTNTTTHSDEE